MRIKVKRIDKSLPMLTYKTKGAAALDMYCRLTIKIPPKGTAIIPLNICLELPKDHWFLLGSRSSTFKLGLMPVNGIGIGDEDFKGDNDEYVFPVFNFTDQNVTIEKGTRIAQGVVLSVDKAKIKEVERLENKDRGGLGSTGK